jgi:hypothetical protein
MTIDGRDRRLRESFHLTEDLSTDPAHLIPIVNLTPVLKVTTRAEDPIDASGDDDDTGLPITFYLPYGFTQFFQCLSIQGVNRRTPENQECYRSFPPHV